MGGPSMPIATMMNELQNYPAEERVALANAVLQTPNPVAPAVQAEWLETAKRRMQDDNPL